LVSSKPGAGHVGLIERLRPCDADILQQVWIVDEQPQGFALAVPRPLKTQPSPSSRSHGSPIMLMKSRAGPGRLQNQAWHRHAPKVVKCCIECCYKVNKGSTAKHAFSGLP